MLAILIIVIILLGAEQSPYFLLDLIPFLDFLKNASEISLFMFF